MIYKLRKLTAPRRTSAHATGIGRELPAFAPDPSPRAPASQSHLPTSRHRTRPHPHIVVIAGAGVRACVAIPPIRPQVHAQHRKGHRVPHGTAPLARGECTWLRLNSSQPHVAADRPELARNARVRCAAERRTFNRAASREPLPLRSTCWGSCSCGWVPRRQTSARGPSSCKRGRCNGRPPCASRARPRRR